MLLVLRGRQFLWQFTFTVSTAVTVCAQTGGAAPPDEVCEPLAIPSPADATYARACPTGATTAECDRWWHLRQSGILRARTLLARRLADTTGAPASACRAGAGVVVAQMDTGVVDKHSNDGQQAPLDRASMHPLLQASTSGPYSVLTRTGDGRTSLPLSYSRSLISFEACQPGELVGQLLTCAARDEDAADVPRDKFSSGDSLPGLTQSGHGTGTMHVLLQAAPAVSVVPYKFAGGIIVTPGRAAQLARAVISAAVEDRLGEGHDGRIDIMSMSLGRRSPSEDLEHALLTAEAQGIILVAAAGQWPLHPTRTRYPARYPSVIAVTGTRIGLEPWTKAGHGANLVAAPAVGIWRASWKRGAAEYKRGTGTSFAAPQVAATAAMWIQYHGGRAVLDAKYGRAAVPSVFRWVLDRAGTRRPDEVCRDLLAGEPQWEATCRAAKSTWETERWGRGILAADRVLLQPLPSRDDVCAAVMRDRGPVAYAAICPEPVRTEAARFNPQHLTVRPAARRTVPITYVAGASLVGKDDSRAGWFEPAVSFGLIWSGYELESPGGLLTQATVNRHAQELSVGVSGLLEYGANGPTGKLDVFPVFGPTIGMALTLTGIREDAPGPDKWWIGPKAQLTYYRVRVQAGWVWGVAGTRGNHGLFTLGVGF